MVSNVKDERNLSVASTHQNGIKIKNSFNSTTKLRTCRFYNNMIKLVSPSLNQLQKHFNKISTNSATKTTIINHEDVLIRGGMTGNQWTINIHLTELQGKITLYMSKGN